MSSCCISCCLVASGFPAAFFAAAFPAAPGAVFPALPEGTAPVSCCRLSALSAFLPQPWLSCAPPPAGVLQLHLCNSCLLHVTRSYILVVHLHRTARSAHGIPFPAHALIPRPYRGSPWCPPLSYAEDPASERYTAAFRKMVYSTMLYFFSSACRCCPGRPSNSFSGVYCSGQRVFLKNADLVSAFRGRAVLLFLFPVTRCSACRSGAGLRYKHE